MTTAPSAPPAGPLPALVPPHRRPDRTVADVRLLPWQRWSMLAALAAVFLVGGDHPVWRNPFDIDRAVWFSYAPIPLLVAAALLYARRLSWLTWFLNTVEITALKFAITYSVAIALWAVTSPPPRPAEGDGYHHQAGPPPAAARAPEATPWPEHARGTIRGTVRDGAGQPVAGAFVYVGAGLDDLVFARPDEPVVLPLTERGFVDSFAVVQRWQPLFGEARDGRMHALQFRQHDQPQRSAPVVPGASPSPLRHDGLAGIFTLRCVLHGESMHLAVLHHPHHTRSDAAGRFTLPRVPLLPLELGAWHPERGTEASRYLNVSSFTHTRPPPR